MWDLLHAIPSCQSAFALPRQFHRSILPASQHQPATMTLWSRRQSESLVVKTRATCNRKIIDLLLTAFGKQFSRVWICSEDTTSFFNQLGKIPSHFYHRTYVSALRIFRASPAWPKRKWKWLLCWLQHVWMNGQMNCNNWPSRLRDVPSITLMSHPH